MSTELKGTTCHTGDLTMTQFHGGAEHGRSVQLTFEKPQDDPQHIDACHAIGYWFVSLTQAQALELAEALVEFASGTREELD